MSVTVVIKEGGLGKSLTVDKLKTNVSGGGTQLWIPEKNMTTKTITENGTYEAKDADVPGWNKVIVNVAGGEGGSVTGRDPDTGEDVNVSVDPETGEIVETVVPSSIRITTPPTKTTYNDGDTINFSGIVVHGYSQTGQDLGVIPFNQLVFPVTVADRSQGYEYDSAGSSLDISPLPNPCPYTEGSFVNTYEYTIGNKRYGYTYTFTPASGRLVRTFGLSRSYDDTIVRAFFATNESGPLGILNTRRVDLDTGVVLEDSDRFYTASASYAITIADKTAYYITDVSYGVGRRGDGASVSIPDIYWPVNTGNNGNTAWTLIFGNVTEGGSMVPVQWARTGDGRILEDSFSITIN